MIGLLQTLFAWIYKNLNIRIEHKNMQYDEEVLKKYGYEAGYTNFIVSKQNSSSSHFMTGSDTDLKHPRMSLYGELAK